MGICKSGSCQYPRGCRELHQTLSNPTDGTYTIDPDGAGGVSAFDVYCDMTTDGGGWIKLVPIDPNDTQVFSSELRTNNTLDKCTSNAHRYYDHVSDSSYVPDFRYESDTSRRDENPIRYRNPVTGQPFDLNQVDAIRDNLLAMSTTTKQAAYSCDDDGNDPNHEAYIYDTNGNQRNLTPGVPGDDDAQWYVYHTDASETFSTSANAKASPLSLDEVLPTRLRWGTWSPNNGEGGGVIWGYTKDHVLVRVK
jgi:hypothetical protein